MGTDKTIQYNTNFIVMLFPMGAFQRQYQKGGSAFSHFSCNSLLTLHTSQVAHQAGAYPSFCSMKRLGIFSSPLDGSTPSFKFASTNLYTWEERGAVRIKGLV